MEATIILCEGVKVVVHVLQDVLLLLLLFTYLLVESGERTSLVGDENQRAPPLSESSLKVDGLCDPTLNMYAEWDPALFRSSLYV